MDEQKKPAKPTARSASFAICPLEANLAAAPGFFNGSRTLPRNVQTLGDVTAGGGRGDRAGAGYVAVVNLGYGSSGPRREEQW